MPNTRFEKLLAQKGVLLCDGSTGVELQHRGLPPGEPPERLLLENPDIILQLHRDYIAAGADILETDSFGANRSRAAHYGLENRIEELCRKAAHLARQAADESDREVLVAGSIGPTGQVLAPLGPLEAEQALEQFAEAAAALAAGGVDVLFIETMMALEEAQLAARAAQQVCDLPVVVTFSFEMGQAGARTPWGLGAATAVRKMEEAGATVVGANCGRGFEEMLSIVQEMAEFATLPLAAQPNAGLPKWDGGKIQYPTSPEEAAAGCTGLLKLGVRLVGGCCGTGPQHIREMRQAVDRFLAEMEK